MNNKTVNDGGLNNRRINYTEIIIEKTAARA